MTINWNTFEYPDREKLIEWLCDSDKNHILENDAGLELLYSYLEFGFKGYREFTDRELRTEYRERIVMSEIIGRPV